jgi:folate-dependent tRNA-U54 methylase TrmFO/GidA
MNANFGLLAPLDEVPRDKNLKKQKLAERALAAMSVFVRELGA